MNFSELPQEVQDEFVAKVGPNPDIIGILGNTYGTGYTIDYWEHFSSKRGPQKVGKRIEILDPTGKTQRSEESKRYIAAVFGPDHPAVKS